MPNDDDFGKPSESGMHVLLPDGRIVPVDMSTGQPMEPERTDPEIPAESAQTTTRVPPWVRSILVPIAAGVVGAFVTAGGAITIGASTGTNPEDFLHLTEEDVDRINQEMKDLHATTAALVDQNRLAREEADALEARIHALELQYVELATSLRFLNIERSPP